MVDMNAAFPSKYLAASDLNGGELTLQINSCAMEQLGEDMKPILYFAGQSKGLVLNKTNASTLSDLYGSESDNWGGKSVTLFAIWTEFQGRQTQGLRVRAPQQMQQQGQQQQTQQTQQQPDFNQQPSFDERPVNDGSGMQG